MVLGAVGSRHDEELVKENVAPRAPLAGGWLLAALAASAALLGGVALIDLALPAPLGSDAPPERFRGLSAHELLVNLTSIGPRVAGSYENEVLAVSMLVSSIKHIAQHASPHNRVELDVHTASGAFALSFMDGMSNVYRDVQSVVARVRGVGGRPRDRSALLLNCHFDTVPDSPGASDDGAGCAVLLEVLRALAAARRPLRHDAVLLLNGAEENILQASHAFVTRHAWARDVRAFVNIEACGAGGREVLFQAGPHDPWIIEMYAGAVPYPFASSLAQELFQSGLIPADTDFRIFRDFGNLSGVDLAWSANGYVYHTRLDTPERVPPAALQRTGDNVLALAHALAGAWAAARRLWGRPALLRGWWGARAWHDAGALTAALLLLLAALRGLRSGFLPLLWALLPALADLLASAARLAGGARAALWVAGAALPAALTWYLALGSLQMFVPIMGRAGSGPLPGDVTMALLVAVLVQACCSWTLPLVVAARGVRRLAWGAALCCGAALLLALAGGPRAAYSAERPQRLMVFHTRRTLHAPLGDAAHDSVENFYWVPELDANTPHSVAEFAPELAGARRVSGAECARLLYCGAPYYLPVLSLISASHRAAAPEPPRVRLDARLSLQRLNATALRLSVELRGPAHVVLVVSPAEGARLAWSSVLAAPAPGLAWGARRTYFVALHAARAGAGAAGEAQWSVQLELRHAEGLRREHWADVSVGGHALWGAHKLSPAHAALLAALPDWVAATGWGVDLHLYRL